MREWDNNHHNAHTLLTWNPLPEGSIDSHHNSSHGPNLCDRCVAFSSCSELLFFFAHRLYQRRVSKITYNTIFIRMEVLTNHRLLIKGWYSFTALHVMNRQSLCRAGKGLKGGKRVEAEEKWEHLKLYLSVDDLQFLFYFYIRATSFIFTVL